ncbi:MAG: helix-turn-helix domain-containing protein [Pseudomonadota bacterium]
MLRKPISGHDTPLVRAINEVGDGWILLILWAACNDVTRFDEFQRELGVARNILSERLRKLVDAGLLKKQPISDGARRMEYKLTSKGMAIEDSLRALYHWGDAWVETPDQIQLRAAE